MNRSMASLLGTAPPPGNAGKPAIQNPDGSFSTERTITIGADGGFYNIPTIVNGQQHTSAEAVALYRAGQNPAVDSSSTEAGAIALAKSRSAQIGASRDNTGQPLAASTGRSMAGMLGGAPAAQPAPPEPVSGAPGDTAGISLGSILGDMAEGATAPFTGAGHAVAGLLADPMFRVLPYEDSAAHLKEAERLGWKGAAFWGSMLAGGPATKLPIAMVWRLAASGAAGGAVYSALANAPSLQHGYQDPKTYASEIATTATFGALTGGALAMVPPAARVAGRAAAGTAAIPFKGMNRLIDVVPGGRQVRAKTAQFLNDAFYKAWHPVMTSGETVLRNVGLGNLADGFKSARSVAALKAGELVAGFYKNIEGLSPDEVRRVGWFIEKFDFSDPELFGVAKEYTTNAADARLFGVAQREANRMSDLGKMMQKTGMQVYDPEDGAFHRFALRKNYVPHRFVNPETQRPGGEAYDTNIAIVMKKKNIVRQDAEQWMEAFSNRIENWNNGVVEGRFPVGTAGHYLIGRALGLQGFETSLDKILPQYYEHVSRRLTNHMFFGPDQLTDAVAAGVREVAPEGRIPPESAVIGQAEATPRVPPKAAQSMWEIIYARKNAAERAARRDQAIEFKYPKAFSALEGIKDPEQQKLATTIVRRQFGVMEDPQFGKKALEILARNEVVTKLALGAIAQPSQMMSAVVRTGYRNSLKSLAATISQDPETLDFALRSGVILRSVVREAQQSLTGRDTEFLDRVLFTQFDVASRIYGAVQGACHSEYMAGELTRVVAQSRRVMQMQGLSAVGAKVLGMPGVLKNRIAGLESRFVKLGIDPVEIVKNGGTLTNEQLLKAAQTVSTDVNFWGDQLSLPAFYRSPYGRYISMFKSFGFQQTRLVKDHMVKPFADWIAGKPGGDPGPLMRFAVLMPLGGEAISDLKAIARAKERPTDAVLRVSENIGNAAGFGLAADALRATDFGVSGSLGLVVGPIGGTFGKAGAAVGEAKLGKFQKTGRFAIEYGLPVAAAAAAPGAAPFVAAVAPAISNVVFPKREIPK